MLVFHVFPGFQKSNDSGILQTAFSAEESKNHLPALILDQETW